MKKLLLIFCFISPFAHAMEMNHQRNSKNTSSAQVSETASALRNDLKNCCQLCCVSCACCCLITDRLVRHVIQEVRNTLLQN